ncbi:MAG: hypothetical protein AAGD33_15795 [Actinomycetota bacterium]
MPPSTRSISLSARSGLVGASDRVDSARTSVELLRLSPWPAPDPAARVFWMAAPAEFASAVSIVDDSVWGPPVAGTAITGIPAPDLVGPIATDAAHDAATGTVRSSHGRRMLAALGAAIVAAAGGLALVIALV